MVKPENSHCFRPQRTHKHLVCAEVRQLCALWESGEVDLECDVDVAFCIAVSSAAQGSSIALPRDVGVRIGSDERGTL